MTREEAVMFLASSVRRTLEAWSSGWTAADILKHREESWEGYSSPSGTFYNYGSPGTWFGDKRLKGKRGHVLIGNQKAGVYWYIPFQEIIDAVEGKPQQLSLF